MGYFEYAITILFIAVSLNLSIMVGAVMMGETENPYVSEITAYLPTGLSDMNAISDNAEELTTVDKFEPTGNVISDTVAGTLAFFTMVVNYAVELLNFLWFLMYGYIVGFKALGWPSTLIFFIGNLLAVLVSASVFYIGLIIFSSITGGGLGK